MYLSTFLAFFQEKKNLCMRESAKNGENLEQKNSMGYDLYVLKVLRWKNGYRTDQFKQSKPYGFKLNFDVKIKSFNEKKRKKTMTKRT